MKPKRIVKGTRVKIAGNIPGMEGWWKVVNKEGNGLSCQRKTKGTKGSKDETWITEDQVSHFSNSQNKLKGKRK